MKKNYKSILLLSACFITAGVLSAAQWIWQGTNKNWSTKSNWIILNAPNNQNSIQPADTVIIPPGVSVYPSLGGGTLFGRLELRGGNIDFSAKSLTVTDSFIWTGGNLVNSNSSGIDILDLNNVRVDFSGSSTVPSNVRITVDGGLWLKKGIINVVLGNNNDVVMGPGSSTAGASDISHIAGRVRKEGNSAFTFPVGDNGQYAPIGIGAPSNATDVFTARYYYFPYANTSSINTNGLDHINITEHWILERTVGISNVSVTLSYENPRSGQITEPADLVVARFNGSQWMSQGKSSNAGGLGSGTVTSNVVTDFSPFTLGSTSTLNPLPLDLISFRAAIAGKNAELKWSVANSEDLIGFGVEKSADGKNWVEIAAVNALEEQSAIVNYSYTDLNTENGIQYYRLRISEASHDAVYSPIVSVKMLAVLSAYPNPSADVLHINAEAEDVQVNIFDATGRLVLRVNGMQTLQSGINISMLNKGIYTIEVLADGITSKETLIKN